MKHRNQLFSVKKLLSLALTGGLLIGTLLGPGTFWPSASDDPSAAFSDWITDGWSARTEAGEAVLYGGSPSFNLMDTRYAVNTAFLEYDVYIEAVHSAVDGNIGAVYTTAIGHQLFFEYNTVLGLVRIRRLVDGGDQHIGSAKIIELATGMWHHHKILLEENHLCWYIDGELIYELNDSYGETLTGGTWRIQGYNTTLRVKNIRMYNSLSGAFPEWSTDGWERSVEGEEHILTSPQGVSLSRITTKEALSLNCLELDIQICQVNSAIDANVGISFMYAEGQEYFFEYNTVYHFLRVRRFVNGGEEQLALLPSVELETSQWQEFRIIINDNCLEWYVNGEQRLVVSDTSGDMLASGSWAVQAYNNNIRLKNLSFSNVISDTEEKCTDCDFEFNSAASVESFSASNGSVSYDNGSLVYTVTGKGSYLSSPLIDAEVGTAYSAKLNIKNTLLLRIKNETDATQIKVYFKTNQVLRYSEDNAIVVNVAPGSGWQTVYVNLSACPGAASGYLKGFRIVPVDATGGAIALDAISFEREKAVYGYAGEILSCVADKDQNSVTITGRLDNTFADAIVRLYELDVNNWKESVEGLTPTATVTANGETFTIVIPFQNGKITRLSSLFLATAVTTDGEVKISDRFQVENYADFSENPYAFTVPELSVKVTDAPFGARGDGFTDDTAAIQAAIDYVSAQGGGTVILEGNHSAYGRRYIATNIKLKDNVELRIETGAVLWQSPRAEEYTYDVVYGHDVVIPGINWTHTFLCHNYPLIQGDGVSNIRVTGGGTVRMADTGSENLDGVDGSTLWTGCGSRIHIIPFGLYECTNVEISDITILRSNSYHVGLFACENVYIGNLTCKEVTCASGDGIGMGIGTNHVLIDRFTIYSNDDAVTFFPTYNDPRGLTWWHAHPGADNSITDVTVKSSYIFGGHGITFIPWGTDAPDLSLQEIRNIQVFDCILTGACSIGTWPDNPYYGKPFDNTETDDFSPVTNVRIHDNLYKSTCTLECIQATDVISDCGIVSHSQFVNGNFERQKGESGWTSGLSNWSYTVHTDSVVKAVEVADGHAGYISGTGSLYEGLYIGAGVHTFKIDTNLITGDGILFVRNAETGEILVSLPLQKGNHREVQVAFRLTSACTLYLGVEMTQAGELYIDNASVSSESTTTAYPDTFTEDFETRIWPTFDYNGEIVIQEDGNTFLTIPASSGAPRAILLHSEKGDFDLRYHIRITNVTSSVDGNAGILFHKSDDNTYYFLEYNSVHAYIQLRKFIGGTVTVLDTKPMTLTSGQWYLLGLRIMEGTIEVYLDCDKVMEVSDDSPLRAATLSLSGYYTEYDIDNITLAEAGTLDMSETVPLVPNTRPYILSFSTNGGSPIPDAQVLEEGASPALVDDPALEGFTFAGWTLNGEVIDLHTFQMPAGNVNLVAIWQAEEEETETQEEETETQTDIDTDKGQETGTEPATDSDTQYITDTGRDPSTTTPSETIGTAADNTAGGCRSALGIGSTVILLVCMGAAYKRRRK